MYHGTHITKERLCTRSIYIILYIFKKPFPQLVRMCSFRSSSYGSVIHISCQYFQSLSIHSLLLLLFYHPSFFQIHSVLPCPVLSPPSPNACWLFVSCSILFVVLVLGSRSLSLSFNGMSFKKFFYYRTQTGIL